MRLHGATFYPNRSRALDTMRFSTIGNYAIEGYHSHDKKKYMVIILKFCQCKWHVKNLISN